MEFVSLFEDIYSDEVRIFQYFRIALKEKVFLFCECLSLKYFTGLIFVKRAEIRKNNYRKILSLKN